MRRLIVPFVLLIGIVFIVNNQSEAREVTQVLRKGDWRFLFLAFLGSVIWLVNNGMTYWSIFRALEIDESFDQLMYLASASNFMNVIAPSMGVGGMAVFLTYAKTRGRSTAKVTLAGILFVIFEYLGFLIVLALGLIVLFRRSQLSIPELIASGVLFLLASFLAFLLFLGTRAAEKLASVLTWIVNSINKLIYIFIKRDYISVDRTRAFAYDANSAFSRIKSNPKSMLLPAIFGLSSKLILVTILALMFLAFKVEISLGTVIAGFSIGYLFLIMSPTPAGIGFVEGAMTLGLNSMYIPLDASVVIVLAYRGFSFWIPLLFGMISFRLLTLDRSEKSPV